MAPGGATGGMCSVLTFRRSGTARYWDCCHHRFCSRGRSGRSGRRRSTWCVASPFQLGLGSAEDSPHPALVNTDGRR
eukprot:850066-Prorocentrum_minimum.AAC.1